ncbi:MAG: hypothetical protein ACK458_05425 [Sphingobacteriales bacterium]|jgi:hypothetical protein
MKRVQLFMLAMVVTLSVWAQDDEPYMVKSFTGVKRVKAQTSGGNISVTGQEGNTAKVEVVIRSNNNNRKLSNEEIKAKLEDYELKVEAQGDMVVLLAKNKRNGWNKDGLSISFRITSPKEVSTNLVTSGGNISLRNLNGEQDFTTSGGNLVVADLRGDINGRTSGGNINAERVFDNVDLTTSGGNVSAIASKGKLTLTTSGGNLQLEDLEGTINASTSGGAVNGNRLSGQIEASTSGGNVVLQHISGSLKAGTSGGNVKVYMDKVDQYVKLSNSGGGIDIDLPDGKGYTLDLRGDKINTSTLRNFSGSTSEGKMNGTLNGGGAQITAGNSGRINLSFH